MRVASMRLGGPIPGHPPESSLLVCPKRSQRADWREEVWRSIGIVLTRDHRAQMIVLIGSRA